MLRHQELIIAIKDAIKPGLEICFKKPFEKEMVADYFNTISKKTFEVNKKRELVRIESKLKIDLELNQS